MILIYLQNQIKHFSLLINLDINLKICLCRLNAGLQHAVDDSDQKAALYMQAKADRQLNLTFPPAKSRGTTAAENQDRLGYAFSGWSDSPVGVFSLFNY